MRSGHRFPIGLLGSILSISLTGCDAQVDSGYLGEPLLVVRGQNVSDALFGPAEVVLVWAGGTPAIHGRTELIPQEIGHAPTTDFDSFTIQLFVPPPSSALILTGVIGQQATSSIGVATIVAVPLGERVDGNPSNLNPMGGVQNHVILYATERVSEGEVGKWFLTGSLDAGYHLMSILSPEDTRCFDTQIPCLQSVLNLAETQVRLQLGQDWDPPF